MIDSDINAIIIKVAAMGLDPKKHLGKSIAEMYSYLLEIVSVYNFVIALLFLFKNIWLNLD